VLLELRFGLELKAASTLNCDYQFKSGLEYLEKGQWKDAATVFRQMVEKNSKHGVAWSHLGFAFLKQEEWQKAEIIPKPKETDTLEARFCLDK